jgi:hypothetical protein
MVVSVFFPCSCGLARDRGTAASALLLRRAPPLRARGGRGSVERTVIQSIMCPGCARVVRAHCIKIRLGQLAQAAPTRHELRKSGKLLETKLQVRYLYNSDGLADGVMEDDQTGLLPILSAVAKGTVKPEAATADVSAIVAMAVQDKYVTVLGERVALWHQGVNDVHAHVDDAIAAINWLERRLTGESVSFSRSVGQSAS